MAANSLDTLTHFAQSQASAFNGDLATFAHKYIDELSLSYHYGFAVACISLIVSMLIYQVSVSYTHLSKPNNAPPTKILLNWFFIPVINFSIRIFVRIKYTETNPHNIPRII